MTVGTRIEGDLLEMCIITTGIKYVKVKKAAHGHEMIERVDRTREVKQIHDILG